MIEHVFRRTLQCSRLDAVYVATCDKEIRHAVVDFGGEVIMTSDAHERASDRVAEASAKLEADVIVMVQGDEPMTSPEMIDTALEPFIRGIENVVCVNLVAKITTEDELRDPNTIKVVMDQSDRALYFSREPIPTSRLNVWGQIPSYRQVCIIPFKKEMLLHYASLAPTPLEKAESVDMLRLLEHGYPVHLVETSAQSHPVDTPQDLERVEALMRKERYT